MSPKQWLSLLTFYILYLIFGASIFYHVEHKLETDRRAAANGERIEINALLRKYLIPNNTELQGEILDEVSHYCEKPVTHPSEDKFVAPFIWNFYHAFFFSFTVCSTVGYGNITPTNTFGRIFLIFYGIVGLPVHAILFGYMGNFWGNSFVKLHKRYKDYKLSLDPHHVPQKYSLIGQISLYLIPGFFVFIFAPAMLFSFFEDWEYSTSVYYAFVTLTTIGFGDFVPTFQKHQEHEFGVYFVFYELFILCWFIAGVSYIAMIIGFLIKGLRSKKIKRIEHHLAKNIKGTQRKIWNGVQRDVGYIRKILNEVYLLKFKPVYKDPEERDKEFRLPRSQSCPQLFMDDNDEEEEDRIVPNIKLRERAFSEHCIKFKRRKSGINSISSMTLNRPQSDGDLSYIDKEKTFAFNAQQGTVEPSELLAKVALALGGFQLNENEHVASVAGSHNRMGIDGFSDSQILASEQNNSNWSLGPSEKSFITPVYTRNRRALSEVRIPIEDSVKASTEWTWSGANTQISEIEKIRSRASKPKENLYKASFQQTKLRYDVDANDFSRDLPTKLNGTATNKSLLRKLNPFRRKVPDMMKRHSLAAGHELNAQKYLGKIQSGRASVSSLSKSYLSHARPSLFTVPCHEEEQNLLETTSVADLIRALEIFHTDNVSAQTSQEQKQAETAPRKSSLLTLLHRRHHSSHTIHGGPTAGDGAIKRARLYSCVTGNLHDNERGNPFIKQRSPSLLPPPPYSVSSPTSGVKNDLINPTLKRRFSVRPANLDKAPGQFHKQSKYPTPGAQSTSPAQSKYQQNTNQPQ